jgi:hypothetical protein
VTPVRSHPGQVVLLDCSRNGESKDDHDGEYQYLPPAGCVLVATECTRKKQAKRGSVTR